MNSLICNERENRINYHTNQHYKIIQNCKSWILHIRIKKPDSDPTLNKIIFSPVSFSIIFYVEILIPQIFVYATVSQIPEKTVKIPKNYLFFMLGSGF